MIQSKEKHEGGLSRRCTKKSWMARGKSESRSSPLGPGRRPMERRPMERRSMHRASMEAVVTTLKEVMWKGARVRGWGHYSQGQVKEQGVAAASRQLQ